MSGPLQPEDLGVTYEQVIDAFLCVAPACAHCTRFALYLVPSTDPHKDDAYVCEKHKPSDAAALGVFKVDRVEWADVAVACQKMLAKHAKARKEHAKALAEWRAWDKAIARWFSLDPQTRGDAPTCPAAAVPYGHPDAEATELERWGRRYEQTHGAADDLPF